MSVKELVITLEAWEVELIQNAIICYRRKNEYVTIGDFKTGKHASRNENIKNVENKLKEIKNEKILILVLALEEGVLIEKALGCYHNKILFSQPPEWFNCGEQDGFINRKNEELEAASSLIKNICELYKIARFNNEEIRLAKLSS